MFVDEDGWLCSDIGINVDDEDKDKGYPLMILIMTVDWWRWPVVAILRMHGDYDGNGYYVWILIDDLWW